MGLADDVKSGVDGVLAPAWDRRDGQVVPDTDDIALKNGAVDLSATYLYADMADSTGLAQRYKDEAVAKVIRSFLNAATRIIRAKGGHIRSFDGDRVMGIFIGGHKNNDAVSAAHNIHWAVSEVIQPKLEAKYKDFAWKMNYGIGIDTGKAMLVRGGVRGNNDIISIGSAPNVAAKLSELRNARCVFVTKAVHNVLSENRSTSSDGRDMWELHGSLTYGGKAFTVYKSTWWVKP